ncbi:hypothetical protein ABIA33_003873 [Streptacidiphilus sp. MAP12-16]|uniref:hypothetical protein n=1 Tax=Streptacidiphilus sp. MAP12-16 TaxID=3156300 RepID=UPI003517C0B8
MAKLHAALTGAALAVLALTVGATPAVANAPVAQWTAAGSAGQATRSAPGTALVTSGNAAITPAVVALDVVTLDPSTTRPGGSVDLRTFADCGGTSTGTATSPAFAAPANFALAPDGGLYVEARVARDAKPGTYRVVEVCGGRAVAAGSLRVVHLGALATGGGWGATRAEAAVTWAGVPDGAESFCALALTGATAIGGLALVGRRFRRFRDSGRG